VAAVVLVAIGIAITLVSHVVPNVLSAAMLVAFAVALEIQVRLVEEPYLLRVHSDAYRRYAARTGRFVPGLGRLRAGDSEPPPGPLE
jgi:protein-S-isoprenylcysteine O-methyltransferase Ste14